MSDDRNEALRLADAARIAELEQALDRLQGNYLIAFERGRIAGIAELEARVHTCGPTCSKAGCINRRLTEERDQLRAEVERLKPDAERWEYALNSEEFAVCEWVTVFGNPCWVPISEESAIDAARTTHKETE